jgi:hypothetical protein
MHDEAEVHETACSVAVANPVTGSGVGVTFHDPDPCQTSAKGFHGMLLEFAICSPTAMQNLVFGHDTDANSSSVLGPGRAGVVIDFHGVVAVTAPLAADGLINDVAATATSAHTAQR